MQNSKPAYDLLHFMMLESDNLYADSFTKLLGYTLYKRGTYKAGAYAIKMILNSHLKLDSKKWILEDGAGSRYDLIAAEYFIHFLTNIYQDSAIREDFISLLPRMGVSGTLKERMSDSILKGKIAAKTGSMHDISALTGYLFTSQPKPLVFSIISNGVSQLVSARKMEEELLLAIYNDKKNS